MNPVASKLSKKDLQQLKQRQDLVNVQTIIELFDTPLQGNRFHPQLYVACQEYLNRSLPARLAFQRHMEDGALTDDDFQQLPLNIQVHILLERPMTCKVGKFFVGFQVVLSLATILAVILESLPVYQGDIWPDQAQTWRIVDGIISTYFLLELIVRIAVFPPPRRRLFTSFTTYIQFASCLPFFFTFVVTETGRNILGFLKALRLLRSTSLFTRMGVFEIILIATRRSIKALAIPLGIVACLSLYLSSALYYAERGVLDPQTLTLKRKDCMCESSAAYLLGKVKCPPVETPFYSMLHALWLVVQTVTTVGYGDIQPLCPYGRFVMIIAMLIGVIGLALPVALLGFHFTTLEASTRQRQKDLKESQQLLGLGGQAAVSSSSEGGEEKESERGGGGGGAFSLGSLKRAKSSIRRGSVGSVLSQPISPNAAESTAATASSKAAVEQFLTPAGELIKLLQDNVRYHGVATPLNGPYVVGGGGPGGGIPWAASRGKEFASADHPLACLDLLSPHPEVLFYINLYLNDFAEELSLRPQGGGRLAPGSGDVIKLGRYIADLVPVTVPKTRGGAAVTRLDKTTFTPKLLDRPLRLSDTLDVLRVDIWVQRRLGNVSQVFNTDITPGWLDRFRKRKQEELRSALEGNISGEAMAMLEQARSGALNAEAPPGCYECRVVASMTISFRAGAAVMPSRRGAVGLQESRTLASLTGNVFSTGHNLSGFGSLLGSRGISNVGGGGGGEEDDRFHNLVGSDRHDGPQAFFHLAATGIQQSSHRTVMEPADANFNLMSACVTTLNPSGGDAAGEDARNNIGEGDDDGFGGMGDVVSKRLSKTLPLDVPSHVLLRTETGHASTNAGHSLRGDMGSSGSAGVDTSTRVCVLPSHAQQLQPGTMVDLKASWVPPAEGSGHNDTIREIHHLAPPTAAAGSPHRATAAAASDDGRQWLYEYRNDDEDMSRAWRSLRSAIASCRSRRRALVEPSALNGPSLTKSLSTTGILEDRTKRRNASAVGLGLVTDRPMSPSGQPMLSPEVPLGAASPRHRKLSPR